MKKLTKNALKKEITHILKETISKCVKLAHANGYELCESEDSLEFTSAAFDRFETGEEMIKKEGRLLFMQEEDLISLRTLSDQAYCDDIILASEHDINQFIKEFDEERGELLAWDKYCKKNERQAEIKKLRKQLAKLEAEEKNDM